MCSSYQPNTMFVGIVEITGANSLDGKRMVQIEFPDLGNVVIHPQQAKRLAIVLRRLVKEIAEGDEDGSASRGF